MYVQIAHFNLLYLLSFAISIIEDVKKIIIISVY